jgi:1,4-dihydroxy-2-naphthoate octaprenyltransferase
VPITLLLVLAVLPVLFEYFIFADELTPLYLVSLLGLGLTVYGVIIPTEIRDYFGDKAMKIETLTVRIGLVKASMLSMILLAVGSALIGVAFVLEFISRVHPMLAISVLTLAAADYIALTKFRRLYFLSKKFKSFTDNSTVVDEITDLSARNPQWIMLITQTYSLLSILLLASKLIEWPVLNSIPIPSL